MTRATSMRLCCPHCGSRARIRKSETLSPTYREGVLECQDPDCGWRGKLSLAITATFTPSAVPNARIRIPLAPGVGRQLRAELERLESRDANTQPTE